MDDLRCPHCRSGTLVGGTCTECGWSLSQTVLLRRPPPPVRVTTVPDCWVLLALSAAMANFFLPILCRAAEVRFAKTFTFGFVAAELGVLSVVGALGSSRPMVRLATTFVAAALLFLVLICGTMLAVGDVMNSVAVRAVGGFFLLLPSLLLAAQAPLWVYRGVTGRRLKEVALHQDSGRPHPTQFGLAQMLLATALIAVTLALARGALALWEMPDANSDAGLVPVVIACAILALASALVTLPCTLAMLVAPRPAAWVLPVLLYGVLAPIFALLILSALFGGSPPGQELGWLGFFSFTTFGGVLAGLGLIRKSGYALVR